MMLSASIHHRRLSTYLHPPGGGTAIWPTAGAWFCGGIDPT
jgi:hypothetical protein